MRYKKVQIKAKYHLDQTNLVSFPEREYRQPTQIAYQSCQPRVLAQKHQVDYNSERYYLETQM
jgi:hypothetical protein